MFEDNADWFEKSDQKTRIHDEDRLKRIIYAICHDYIKSLDGYLNQYDDPPEFMLERMRSWLKFWPCSNDPSIYDQLCKWLTNYCNDLHFAGLNIIKSDIENIWKDWHERRYVNIG